ncbi:hypothetical protein R6Q59_012416 [Mikania micrantha]
MPFKHEGCNSHLKIQTHTGPRPMLSTPSGSSNDALAINFYHYFRYYRFIYATRDSKKMIFEHLQREFEVARASQTQDVCLDNEQWNGGLLATIRELIHLKVDRKAMQSPVDASMLLMTAFHDKITYKVVTKDIAVGLFRILELSNATSPTILEKAMPLCSSIIDHFYLLYTEC